MRSFWLFVSIGIVGADWTASVTSYVMGATVPWTGARHLALDFGVLVLILSTIIWLLLRASGERLAGLGFSRRELRHAVCNREVWRAIGLVLLFDIVIGSIRTTGEPATAPLPTPPIADFFRDPRDFPWWLLIGALAGFGEELERVFCLTRFEKGFGAVGLVLATVVHTAVFALRHSYQGPGGVAAAALAGLVFTEVFLRSRCVADAMVAHGISDLIRVALLYARWAR